MCLRRFKFMPLPRNLDSLFRIQIHIHEPGSPQWKASTLEKSHSNSWLTAARNIYIWACDEGECIYSLYISCFSVFRWRVFPTRTGQKAWSYVWEPACFTRKVPYGTSEFQVQIRTEETFSFFKSRWLNRMESYPNHKLHTLHYWVVRYLVYLFGPSGKKLL